MTDKTDMVEELEAAIRAAPVRPGGYTEYSDIARTIIPTLDRRIAEAVAEERAAMVAWLREFGNHPPLPNCERCNAADAIERGDHRAPDTDRER